MSHALLFELHREVQQLQNIVAELQHDARKYRSTDFTVSLCKCAECHKESQVNEEDDKIKK